MHPVQAANLLHQLATRLKQHVVFPDEAANAVALWVAFAWTHDAATHSPMLLVTSAERDSGKTTLLGLVNLLAPRGLMLIDPSPAVLYRLVEKWKPTLVVGSRRPVQRELPPVPCHRAGPAAPASRGATPTRTSRRSSRPLGRRRSA